jgi:dTDP-glucose 4,6-dehydratase/UDP-glucose 4-epimerase
VDDTPFADAPVLITGGLGFIGSNLARRLVALGARVTLVDSLIPLYGGHRFNVHDLEGRLVVNIADVRDPYAMAHLVQGQRFLFNLAGQTSHLDSMTDPQTDLAINAQAQLSILEACRQHNPSVVVVFASTRQLYGRPQYLPVDEKHPVRPVDINGIHKLAGESYHRLYHEVYGIPTVSLRLTNTYGPGMRVKDARQTFLGIWIRQLLDGAPIRVFGDGTQLRDFNFVDDVVDALLRAATYPPARGQVFNLGSREVVSLAALAEQLVALQPGGRFERVPFPPERKAIDIGDYYGAFDAIETALGWTPRVGLADGLSRTLAYYREHAARYWDRETA